MPLHRHSPTRVGTKLPRALDGRTAVAQLLDAYAGLLTERRQAMMRMYYHDDLSLGEIAVRFGVTRQAVFDSLRRSVGELSWLEERIGMLALRDRQTRTREALDAHLAEVERQAEHLARNGGLALEGLRDAVRGLREAL